MTSLDEMTASGGGGGGGLRLSSILEEDAIIPAVASRQPHSWQRRNEDRDAMSYDSDEEEEEVEGSNPLKEALDAINSLAEQGDFDDVPPVVPVRPERKRSHKSLLVNGDSGSNGESHKSHKGDSNKENEEASANRRLPRSEWSERLSEERERAGRKSLSEGVEEHRETREGDEREEVEEAPCVERKQQMLVINPLEELPLSGGKLSNGVYNFEKILEPSANAAAPGVLLPCHTCQRTFLLPAFERHVRICQKVGTKKPNEGPKAKQSQQRDEASTTKLTRKGSLEPAKRKPLKPEDDCKKCPHCDRKFGPKPYDRHVEWCEEKSRRLQVSPNKDLVALAKLHARTTYRPKTPAKKEDSPSRKTSFFSSASGDSPLPSSIMGDFSRSESRSSRRSSERRSSANGGAGISSLNSTEHTVETPETQFIRAATGRGSIKRGPAPTKASQLRQLAKDQALLKASGQDPAPTYAPSHSLTHASPVHSNGYNGYNSMRSKTPNFTPSARTSLSPLTHRRTTSSAAPSMSASYHAGTTSNHNNPMYSFQPVVKPSVVRPRQQQQQPSSYRRDPEGLEQPKDSANSHGSYDHAAEYDPYQSAARQMQELLFGTTSTPPSSSSHSSSNGTANLRPSTNSAFEKYVPSTADINTKLNSKSSFVDAVNPYLTVPRRADTLKVGSNGSAYTSGIPSFDNGSGMNSSSRTSVVNFNPVVSAKNPAAAPSSGLTGLTGGNRSKSPNVARFCHECGNPFALQSIRFCCECGVKRLYC